MNLKANTLIKSTAEYHKLKVRDLRNVVRQVAKASPMTQQQVAILVNKLLAGSAQLPPMSWRDVKLFFEGRYGLRFD